MTATRRSRFGMTLALVVLAVWPLLPHVPYDALNTAVLACEYCIVAVSLVLLVGMVGQISLCQAALVGMGAFVAALATRGLNVHFPVTLIIGAVAGALTAAAIGVVALRVRGLYLAVATLIFAYVCDQYLFAQPWLVESQSGTSIPFEVIGKPGSIPSFDLADAHIFYYIALAMAAFALYAVANIRDSRIGRAFASVRGSEVAAASLGISVTRYKLLGFACAGGLAGLAGALTLVGQRTVTPTEFNFTNSLYFLSIAVVGGLRSLGGAVASSLFFAVLVGEVFFRSPTLADYLDVISAVLLSLVLLFFRGGMGAIPEQLATMTSAVTRRVTPLIPRRRVAARAEALSARQQRFRPAIAPRYSALVRHLAQRAAHGFRKLALARPLSHQRRRPSPGVEAGEYLAPSALSDADLWASPPALRAVSGGGDVAETRSTSRVNDLATLLLERRTMAGQPAADGRREPTLLSADDVTVRFGGLTAVSEASMSVRAGEVVGLIGPNGAGKTTLFNAILGLNQPATGRITLFGQDVTGWDVHERAALGVGRTFQILQLFSDLTVFENLLVATHLQNRTGLWGSMFVTPGARRREEIGRRRVQRVLELMELTDIADRKVAGLPFGALRLIEVARTLVTGAPLVCFDEPGSGLDSGETEKLLEWFRFLRAIGITLLVIEHDVSFVVRLCDYIYVLDQGKVIAHGRPQQIQRNPEVIASYLGTSADVA